MNYLAVDIDLLHFYCTLRCTEVTKVARGQFGAVGFRRSVACATLPNTSIGGQ